MKKILDQNLIRQFRQVVRAHYVKQGRSFPWRETTDPYHILVSEVMLQQTQVERVVPKYQAFLKQFPTVRVLAKASLGDVLRLWSGLGYNRRAKMLHLCAQELVQNHKGVFPCTQKELEGLPGIGPYTAGALMAFAYNQPVVMIETNIRAVYLHHFFKDKVGIPDIVLLPLIEQTLDKKSPRLWYNMLMDYGSWIKKEYGNPNRKSKHHVVQKKFEGSVRQIRGGIVRALTESASTTLALTRILGRAEKEIREQLINLKEEGFVIQKGTKWYLP